MVSVTDRLSGIRSIKVTSPGSRSISYSKNRILEYPVNIGSVEEVNVWVETSCCYDGVEITAQDLAGRITKCVAGINPNKASTIGWSHIFCNILCLCALVIMGLTRT